MNIFQGISTTATASQCNSSLCNNNGQCVGNANGVGFDCICLPTFTGTFCETGKIKKELGVNEAGLNI